MDEDLDTPQAVDVLEDLSAQVLHARSTGQAVGRAQQTLRTLCEVFGVAFSNPPPSAEGWSRHLRRFTS
jgi:hypothetical protein